MNTARNFLICHISWFTGSGNPKRQVLGKSKIILGLLEGIPTMLLGEVAMVSFTCLNFIICELFPFILTNGNDSVLHDRFSFHPFMVFLSPITQLTRMLLHMKWEKFTSISAILMDKCYLNFLFFFGLHSADFELDILYIIIFMFSLFHLRWCELWFQFKVKPELHYGEEDCPVSVADGFPKDDELHFEIELVDFSKVKARISYLFWLNESIFTTTYEDLFFFRVIL